MSKMSLQLQLHLLRHEHDIMNRFRYRETDLHIAKECVRGFGITFMLAKDSIFTDKFGEVIVTFSL